LLAVGFLTLFAPALVFAAGDRELKVEDATVLEGTSIPPGQYTLRWKGNGPGEYEVTVEARKKVVARATGTRVDLEKPSPYEALIYREAEDGSRHLVEIRFAGESEAIRIETTTEARGR
jgi:hypothetical protein